MFQAELDQMIAEQDRLRAAALAAAEAERKLQADKRAY